MAIPFGGAAIAGTVLRMLVRTAAMRARLKGITMGARYNRGMYGGFIRRGHTMGSAAFGKRGLTIGGQHGRHVIMGHISKKTLGGLGGGISGAGYARNRRRKRRSRNYASRYRR